MVYTIMERIAIPLFQNRVSPVLDSCLRLMLVDVVNGEEVKRTAISMANMALTERVDAFGRMGVDKIICAGVSDLMCKYVSSQKIAMISGVAGEFEEIINAYLCNRLDDECFLMPGKKSAVSSPFPNDAAASSIPAPDAGQPSERKPSKK